MGRGSPPPHPQSHARNARFYTLTYSLWITESTDWQTDQRTAERTDWRTQSLVESRFHDWKQTRDMYRHVLGGKKIFIWVIHVWLCSNITISFGLQSLIQNYLLNQKIKTFAHGCHFFLFFHSFISFLFHLFFFCYLREIISDHRKSTSWFWFDWRLLWNHLKLNCVLMVTDFVWHLRFVVFSWTKQSEQFLSYLVFNYLKMLSKNLIYTIIDY